MAGTARIANGDLTGLDSLDVDALALPMYAVCEQPIAVAGYADWRLAGRIARLLKSGKFSGETDEALLMPSLGRIGPKRIFLLGMGVPQNLDEKRLGERMKQIVAVLSDAGAKRLAIGAPVSVTLEKPHQCSPPISRGRQRRTRREGRRHRCHKG